MTLTPVAGIQQTLDRQWQTPSDHQENAERAAQLLRILILMRHRRQQPMRDEQRGVLLDTYG